MLRQFVGHHVFPRLGEEGPESPKTVEQGETGIQTTQQLHMPGLLAVSKQ